jgi:hypothetical protein
MPRMQSERVTSTPLDHHQSLTIQGNRSLQNRVTRAPVSTATVKVSTAELDVRPAPLPLTELSGVARVEAVEEVLLVLVDNQVVLVDAVPGTVGVG